MRYAVEHRDGKPLGFEDLRQVTERQVAVNDDAAAFVPGAECLEKQFRALLGDWQVAEFIDDQQVDGRESF